MQYEKENSCDPADCCSGHDPSGWVFQKDTDLIAGVP